MDLSIADFPVAKEHKRFRWAPVLFHPVQFSQDRLTIGLIVTDEREAHLLAANRLNKLECLFAGRSEDAIFAASVALEAIQARLLADGVGAVRNFESPVSGVHLGDFRDAEASDWMSLALRWLEASSPLFEHPIERRLVMGQQDEVGAEDGAVPPSVAGPKERLPLLVWEYVADQRPTYARYFSPLVSKPGRRRPSYEAAIDYSGMKVVANFGTLFASRAQSVTNIKRRMWDLSIDMSREEGSMLKRKHEMIVQAPLGNDPQLSDVQHNNLRSALNVLEEEADTKQIRLIPMSTVREIGEHILKLEAA